MTKRPDQYQMDPSEAGATDYKSRRQSEEGNRRASPDELPANQQPSQTPNEAMEESRRASQRGREDELERARRAHERHEHEGHGHEGRETEGRSARDRDTAEDERHTREVRADAEARRDLEAPVSPEEIERRQKSHPRGREEVEERKRRDREELTRPPMEAQQRQLQEDVTRRRDREARETEEKME